MGREKKKNPSGEKTKPREGTDESIGSLGPNDQRPREVGGRGGEVMDAPRLAAYCGRSGGWDRGIGGRRGRLFVVGYFRRPPPCSSGLLLWLAPQIPMSTAKSVDFVDVVVDVDSIFSTRNQVEVQVQLEERRCTR